MYDPGEEGPELVSTTHRQAGYPRRRWLLARLAEADGVSYNELCRSVVEELLAREGKPRSRAYVAANRGVRAVRALLWDGLASTEADESVWFSRAGWDALAAMREPAGSAQG